jgi:hypothetical protein
MSVFQYRSGLGNSASYQVSSIPYLLKGSQITNNTIVEIAFPNVTNFIEIFTAAGSGDLRIGFSSLGIRKSPSPAGTNYILHSAGTSEIYDWRVTSLFLLRESSGIVNYEIRAGLTTIAGSELSNNWSGSAGVG